MKEQNLKLLINQIDIIKEEITKNNNSKYFFKYKNILIDYLQLLFAFSEDDKFNYKDYINEDIDILNKEMNKHYVNNEFKNEFCFTSRNIIYKYINLLLTYNDNYKEYYDIIIKEINNIMIDIENCFDIKYELKYRELILDYMYLIINMDNIK